MLSNSDTKSIKNLYKQYNTSIVKATRMIKCDAIKMEKIKKIVVTNYENLQKKLWN